VIARAFSQPTLNRCRFVRRKIIENDMDAQVFLESAASMASRNLRNSAAR
jgi:hypothetical protein